MITPLDDIATELCDCHKHLHNFQFVRKCQNCDHIQESRNCPHDTTQAWCTGCKTRHQVIKGYHKVTFIKEQTMLTIYEPPTESVSFEQWFDLFYPDCPEIKTDLEFAWNAAIASVTKLEK